MLYFQQFDLPHYRDLRPQTDDKRILKNPHKGWYLHYVDNGMSRKIYRDDIPEDDFLERVPGLNQIYLRVDWSDIEKAEGVFDWSAIDRIMQEWSAHGYTFSFRFVTYEGMAHDVPYATPKWVFDRGAKAIRLDTRTSGKTFPFEIHEPISFEPVYDDEIFLHYVDLFLAECARKFNGHPLVDYIDIGTYGTWGEGHTTSGSETVYPLSTLRKHVDLHLKHFPDTQLFLMYGYITCAANRQEPGVLQFIRDYRDKVGIRCDSVGVDWYHRNFGYDTFHAPDLFDIFGENAPVNIENQHLRFETAEQLRDGLTLLEAFKNAHATYAGFHGYITEWWPKYRYLHEYLANRLGYWYFLRGVQLPETVSGQTEIILHVENRGFARAYHRFESRLTLTDENGTDYPCPIIGGDNRAWLPNTPVAVPMTADFSGIPAGTYQVYYGLTEGTRPIAFAVAEPYCRNEAVLLGKITVE